MTENGDAIVCGDEHVSFVAFADSHDRLRPEAITEFVASAEHVIDMLRDAAGMKPTVPLPWGSLSPEQFEDLCYDVILRSGRFDENTLRKHGKTRSRDGGRDIEAKTLRRFDQPSVKWIFQCKLITSGSALSGTKVTVADAIDQYAAGGFGVMTNEVIDSTLYDKLDAIAANRKLESDTWDGRRLQRFLSSRRDLNEPVLPRVGQAVYAVRHLGIAVSGVESRELLKRVPLAEGAETRRGRPLGSRTVRVAPAHRKAVRGEAPVPANPHPAEPPEPTAALRIRKPRRRRAKPETESDTGAGRQAAG